MILAFLVVWNAQGSTCCQDSEYVADGNVEIVRSKVVELG
jgi:hypothetical protein